MEKYQIILALNS